MDKGFMNPKGKQPIYFCDNHNPPTFIWQVTPDGTCLMATTAFVSGWMKQPLVKEVHLITSPSHRVITLEEAKKLFPEVFKS